MVTSSRKIINSNKMKFFDGENIDESQKTRQICHYFPCHNFMPYSGYILLQLQ